MGVLCNSAQRCRSFPVRCVGVSDFPMRYLSEASWTGGAAAPPPEAALHTLLPNDFFPPFILDYMMCVYVCACVCNSVLVQSPAVW